MDETDAHPHRPSDWTAMDRVEHDIAAGRLWKARDRLNGMLAYYGSQEVLERLGDVCYEMGDLPQAGRFWFLTARDDEDAQRAFAAWRARFGDHPYGLLRSLSGFPDRSLPAVANARLAELRTRAPKAPGPGVEPPPPSLRDRVSDALESAVVGSVVIATVGVWVVGAVAIVRWLL